MGDEPGTAGTPATGRDRPRTLITGGAGLLGSSVVDALRSQGQSVVILDDGSGGTHERLEQRIADSMIRVHRVDLRDAAAVSAVCQEERPSTVIHLAGRHFIPYCNEHPDETWNVNVHGTSNLLAALAPHPPQHMLFASTADVYRPSTSAHREDCRVEPPTIYGRSKLAAEELLLQSCTGWGTRLTITRLFNLYGPEHTVDHLIPTVIAQALAERQLHLGDLSTLRDYVFVDDAAAAIVGLLAGEATGVVNIGTGIATSGEDLVELVGKLLNRELTVVRDRLRLRRHDRPVLVADPTKLRTMLRWWPAPPLDEGLRRVISTQDASP